MVVRHPSSQHASPAPAGSSSAIKPTGWIRSTSKPGVLSDRTNLPSTSRTTLGELNKPVLSDRTNLPSNSRTPLRSVKPAARQAKLSSFFAPHTAPAQSKRGDKERGEDSPSLTKAQRQKGGEVALEEDEELQERANNLLLRRFGSLSRSLNPSRDGTPTRGAPPAPRTTSLPPRATSPSPPAPLLRVEQRSSTTLRPAPVPPRANSPPSPPPPRARAEQRPARAQRDVTPPPIPPVQPSSSPDESLSKFSQPAWEKSRVEGKMALFQRLAGVPMEVVREGERRRMQQELQRAHKRMGGEGRSEARPRVKGGPVELERSGGMSGLNGPGAGASRSVLVEAQKSGERSRLNGEARVKDAEAGPSRLRGQEVSTPGRTTSTTSRAIRSSTLLDQPPGVNGAAAGPSRPTARASPPPSRTTMTTPKALMRSPTTKRRIYALETQAPAPPPLLQPLVFGPSEQPLQRRASSTEAEEGEKVTEEESETLPLPWPEAEGEVEGQGEEVGEETQPLPWTSPPPLERPMAKPLQLNREQTQPLPWSPAASPKLDGVTEVPTSDDEDLLLQTVFSSSDSLPSSASTRSPKRRRVDQGPSSQRLVSLTPNGGFDSMLAALKKQERKAHAGTQLSLNSFIPSSRPSREVEEGEEDLGEILSDDEEEETQPLPWSSPPPPERPTIKPLQLTSSQITSSSTGSGGSGSGMSLPTESNLNNAVLDSQVRRFFDRL